MLTFILVFFFGYGPTPSVRAVDFMILALVVAIPIYAILKSYLPGKLLAYCTSVVLSAAVLFLLMTPFSQG